MEFIRAAEMLVSDADLNRACALFGIVEATELGGFENRVYRSRPPQGLVLRLTHDSRRTVELLRGELDFMAHVASGGVRVPRVIRSREGRTVETILTTSGDTLHACCMTLVHGEARRPPHWSRGSIAAFGELVASLHDLAETFEPDRESRVRPGWAHARMDSGVLDLATYDPELRSLGIRLKDCLERTLRPLERILVHTDAHFGNVLFGESGELALIDFDDCAYGHPAQDVATAIFHWVVAHEDSWYECGLNFLESLVKGYERRRAFPDFWLDLIDGFLSYREIRTYLLIQRNDPTLLNARASRFLEGRRDRILGREPLLGRPLARTR